MKKAILSLVFVAAAFMAYGQCGNCSSPNNSYNNRPDYSSTITTPAQKVEYKIFPNPSADYIQVDEKTIKSGKAKRIYIFSLTGQEVRSFTLSQDGTYDIADLKPGTYLVQFRNFRDKVMMTRKLVKVSSDKLN